MIDTVIDVYHHTTIDFAAVQKAGIVAIIHKATEGTAVRDAEYKARRNAAKKLGFLWGAYHYSSGSSVTDQVGNFLEYAEPADDDFIALDFEGSTSGRDMTLQQARRFVQTIRDELGRWPALYGGRLLRESVGTLRDDVLANCPLWYSRYAGAPIGIPINTWPTYTLWQYTDGNVGPEPHVVPGIGRCDRSRFTGSEEELRQQWPLTRREEGASLGPGALHLSQRKV